VESIRRTLMEQTPFALLAQASSFVEIATERPLDRIGPPCEEVLDGPEFVSTLVDSGRPELIVLAKAMATLMPDGPVTQQLRTPTPPAGAPRWASTSWGGPRRRCRPLPRWSG